MTDTKITLLTKEDIYDGKIVDALQGAFKTMVNVSPKQDWLGDNRGVKYLPIQRVEALLDSVCGDWHVEVKSLELIANSMVCTARLHYWNPAKGEWTWTDGIGAAPVNTNKGAEATDFAQIKHDSVQKAAPAAKAYAVKNAAQTIGRIFGRNVNRQEDVFIQNMALTMNPKDQVIEDEKKLFQ